MILMIDNYDSFTYNLVQYVGELGEELQVYRNDKITLEEIERLAPDYLMISPGPCTPNEAGISMEAIRHFAGKIPILGVCLGHQSIGQVFGAKVIRAERLMHGKTSEVIHDGQTIFQGIPSPFTAARYHSLIVEEASIPSELEITARTAEGEIMALRHREYPIEGVQFHPESIITEHGKQLLQNFLTTYARHTTGS
ncbi:aminodeoxychorismate/anthranilate synthase component II [Brevibacillus sp. FSL K6-0770]|jgi:glutamine amidotransferase of anthranilate synthase or aminodeoxychorismate synthase|uniref:aminodeoxychorismate/anthranilate synthase component II n=1 Tax=Brevibacillus TaxID=55080 RepID=UPI000EED5D8A|nr:MULTISPECIES: aminodeoxychorismate/anthranilate synthase component II [Brevibacillus]MDH6353555.1 para-aminobenzoate synthetase component 2 [Brevibacillus sp. 1238]HBZ82886.1 aminodeoxychorismate/anthranilate synthase component II [Brevibacillus sp.]